MPRSEDSRARKERLRERRETRQEAKLARAERHETEIHKRERKEAQPLEIHAYRVIRAFEGWQQARMNDNPYIADAAEQTMANEIARLAEKVGYGAPTQPDGSTHHAEQLQRLYGDQQGQR